MFLMLLLLPLLFFGAAELPFKWCISFCFYVCEQIRVKILRCVSSIIIFFAHSFSFIVSFSSFFRHQLRGVSWLCVGFRVQTLSLSHTIFRHIWHSASFFICTHRRHDDFFFLFFFAPLATIDKWISVKDDLSCDCGGCWLMYFSSARISCVFLGLREIEKWYILRMRRFNENPFIGFICERISFLTAIMR